MNDFIRKLNEYNLCTWYILPLLDLNIDSFGRAAFMNCYLTTDKKQVVVQVVDRNLCPEAVKHNSFKESYELDGSDYLVFDMPNGWSKDLERFTTGAYSKFTLVAKSKIMEKSGLKYRVADERGWKYTDAILLALEQHPVLRSKWIEILGDDVDMPDELLSKPGSSNFIAPRKQTRYI